MRQNHADITIILDKSGSMAHLQSETITSVNKFINDQKQIGGTCDLTIYQFNSRTNLTRRTESISSFQPLTKFDYAPDGWTALLDAMGTAINETGARLDAMREEDKPEKVIVMTMTDGLENSSHKFNHDQIRTLVDHQSSKYNWQFVFLGANQDAFLTAKGLKIQVDSSLPFSHTHKGLVHAFNSTSDAVTRFRGNTASAVTYTSDDYKKQAKLGVNYTK